VLAPNTPAFLESIYGIVAAGGVIVPANYRLRPDDIAYIFEFAEVDCIIVDQEFVELLDVFRDKKANVPLLVDTVKIEPSSPPGCLYIDLRVQDTGANEGPYDKAVLEGLAYDSANGSAGWSGLQSHADNEDDMLAIPFTSGTTSRPKGVMYTHRGGYLAALGNIIESNLSHGKCRYLWTLPM
jgi:acyl-CoA synthetase (AMP-forming)/AMP-acid ligase II